MASELDEVIEVVGVAGQPSPGAAPDNRVAEEIGDVLFACVNVSRLARVDAELVLRQAAGRFRDRVELAASLAEVDGKGFSTVRPPFIWSKSCVVASDFERPNGGTDGST